MSYGSLNKIFYKEPDRYEQLYQERFQSEAAVKYDFTVGGQPAFVFVHPVMLNLLTEILADDKKISVLLQELPQIAVQQYVKKCIVDEIKLTNEIEGVHSTRREIKDVLGDTSEARIKKRLYGLVNKYEMLLQQKDIPLKSCEDVRKLYDEFVAAEIRPADLPDGRLFRREIVDIVSPSQKVLHQGLYPEEQIISAMQAALELLQNKEANCFVNVAVFHYMFGYIHPFYDGNGRMTRFISSYLLSKKISPVIVLGLSYTIKKHLKQYYDVFNVTNHRLNKGDLTSFVLAFLSFVQETASYMQQDIQDRKEQLEFYSSLLEKQKMCEENDNIKQLLFILVQNALFDEAGLEIKAIVDAIGRSDSTVRNLLHKLPAGILKVDRNGKNKVYRVDLDELRLRL